MLPRLLFVACSTLLLTLGEGKARAEFPRVRALDASVDALLASGYSQSPTFRALVDRLERSDVIVHIERRPWMLAPARVGGILRFVTWAGGFRYLRITLGARVPHETAVALLGHELQHAIEVAGDASVIDDVTFETLYRRIGDPCRDNHRARSYDTAGARDVERRIGGELRESSRRAIARR